MHSATPFRSNRHARPCDAMAPSACNNFGPFDDDDVLDYGDGGIIRRQRRGQDAVTLGFGRDNVMARVDQIKRANVIKRDNKSGRDDRSGRDVTTRRNDNKGLINILNRRPWASFLDNTTSEDSSTVLECKKIMGREHIVCKLVL